MPTKYFSAASLTKAMACASPSALRMLAVLIPSAFFILLAYLSIDSITAKTDELRVRMAPLKCPGFYGMSWIVIRAGKKEVRVDIEPESAVVSCESLGEIFVPAYTTKSRRIAERIAAYLK